MTVSPGIKANTFQRLSPFARIVFSLLFAVVTYCLLPHSSNTYFNALILWDLFAFCYLLLCWIVLCTLPISLIQHRASKEDGSKLYVLAMVILSSLTSLIAVLLMIIHNDNGINKILALSITLIGMAFSWSIVHTIFTFHYAHLHYEKPSSGLLFPGDEKRHDYLDFAYFSFVIGCTFQVSDVAILSKKIRRLALFHGLLAFLLNTFVVALSINIIAGLLK